MEPAEGSGCPPVTGTQYELSRYPGKSGKPGKHIKDVIGFATSTETPLYRFCLTRWRRDARKTNTSGSTSWPMEWDPYEPHNRLPGQGHIFAFSTNLPDRSTNKNDHLRSRTGHPLWQLELLHYFFLSPPAELKEMVKSTLDRFHKGKLTEAESQWRAVEIAQLIESSLQPRCPTKWLGSLASYDFAWRHFRASAPSSGSQVDTDADSDVDSDADSDAEQTFHSPACSSDCEHGSDTYLSASEGETRVGDVSKGVTSAGGASLWCDL